MSAKSYTNETLGEDVGARGFVSSPEFHKQIADVRAQAVSAASRVIISFAFGLIAALRRRFTDWRMEQELRFELSQMSDRDLADIGISRTDLARKDLSTLLETKADEEDGTIRFPANRNVGNRTAA